MMGLLSWIISLIQLDKTTKERISNPYNEGFGTDGAATKLKVDMLRYIYFSRIRP